MTHLKMLGRWYGRVALVLLNTLILLMVIEGVATVMIANRPSPTQIEIEGFMARTLGLDYYLAQDWSRAYWTEHFEADRWDYQPHRLWQTRPYAGTYINIDQNGNRLTHASDCDANTYRIYVFGGSTIWGYGVPDWNTIPTGMQTLLVDVDVCVVNFGELGYTSTQNFIRFSQLLAHGDVPDMAIFYDGANDVTAANRNSIAGGHFYYETIHRVVNTDAFAPSDTSMMGGLLDAVRRSATYRLIIGDPPKIQPDWALPPLDERFVHATVQTYLDTIHMAHALAQTYDVTFMAFIQPILFFSERALSDEEQQFLWEMPGGLSDLFWAVYPQWQAEAENRDYLVYLGNALHDQTERVWIDFNHLTAVGNLAMATEIVNIIRPMIPTQR